MQLLILGEGATDLGGATQDGNPVVEGVLPVLLRKMLAPEVTSSFKLKRFSTVRLNPRRKKGIGPSSYGYANKLRAILGLSEGRDADAIIAVVDRDGAKNADRISELSVGRDFLRENGKQCAVAVAIEMIEAWLLADEKALRIALENPEIPTQPDPEALCSRDEQSDNNPKGRIRSLIGASSNEPTQSREYWELCAAIANHAEIQAISKKCPKGFAPFADQIQELG